MHRYIGIPTLCLLAALDVRQLPPAPTARACDIAGADAQFMQEALRSWEVLTDSVLRIPPRELPWMILFSRTCAFHLAPDSTAPLFATLGAPGAPVALTFRNTRLTVRVAAIRDSVFLPGGTGVPATGLAFTSAYSAGSALRPFFVTALPDVWAADARYAGDTNNDAGFVMDVIMHELVHTLQITAVAARADSLHRQFPALPTSLDDDYLQREFERVTGMDATALVLRRAKSHPRLVTI